MANYGDTNAWITISDGTNTLYIKCIKCTYDKINKASVGVHYPSRGHTGYNLKTEIYQIKIEGIWAKDEAEWNSIKQGIKVVEDMTTGTAKFIKQISTDPHYEKFDGTNHIMPVIIKDIKGYDKSYGGDSEIFEIKMLILEQVGNLASS